ncbi:lipase family protein [Ralstonia pseudosolanacearum]|uniref:lipase family protein n=1 Tax=Ralstonia pseudosolanacearum TaxID=1310165 RepID=UPI003AAD1300
MTRFSASALLTGAPVHRLHWVFTRAIKHMLLVIVLAMSGLTTFTAMASPLDDPRNDPFYTPPQPLPSGPHGTLIRSRPFIPVGLLANGWQILYTSTDVNGAPIAVSGTVLVPWLPWFSGPRPLIAWAPGTQGQADNCAPSHQYALGTEYESTIAGATPTALARGWAIAMTDYQGLGTPGDHTWGVGKAEGQAVLDAALAAQQLSGAGLSASAPVGIMGYSQGGHSAAFAAELQASYAPTLNVKGVAAGAGPYSIADVYANVNGGPFGGVGPIALMGMNAAYPDLNLPAILTPYGQSVIADFRGTKCLVEVTASYPFLSDSVLVQGPTILSRPDWQARMAQNQSGTGVPSVPALVYAGTLDEIIPFDQNQKRFASWCSRGANVAFRTIGATEHATAFLLGFPIAADWMAQRFAGAAAVSECP